tara:strand:+ start:57 stop:236 length:180 start_codon:yes stop_codon:yes gene_type:complete
MDVVPPKDAGCRHWSKMESIYDEIEIPEELEKDLKILIQIRETSHRSFVKGFAENWLRG